MADPALPVSMIEAAKQASEPLQIAIYVGGGLITSAFGAVWMMVRRLSKRLDNAHGKHIGLLEGQIKQMAEDSKALKEQLAETNDSLSDQQRERIEESRQQIERLTSAIMASTDAMNRAEKSNQTMTELIRSIHQDLRQVQDVLSYCRQQTLSSASAPTPIRR